MLPHKAGRKALFHAPVRLACASSCLCRLCLFLLMLAMGLSLWPRSAQAEDAGQEGGLRAWLADHLQVSGWLETMQGIGTYSPNHLLASRVLGRLETALDWKQWHGFFSLEAEKNWVLEDDARFFAREMWLEYSTDSWSLRAGRQIIFWGKADSLRVTDNVSPADYSDFTNRLREELRVPVSAALLRISGDSVFADFIWIPKFRAASFPAATDPWGPLFSVGNNPLLRIGETEEPATTLENSELGLRVSGNFSGFDVAASVLYTWDDNPVYESKLVLTEQGAWAEVSPRHRRMTVFGLDLSFPWEDFVFRAEGAFFPDKHFTSTSLGSASKKKDMLKWVLGVDWSPGNDWMVTAQIYDEYVLQHEADLSSNAHRHIATLNISKKFLNQTLTLSEMAYLMPDDDVLLNRVQAEYSVMDGLTATVGLDLIYGDNGVFREFRENSLAWMKLKYNF